jgi:uncharacterized protein
MRIPPEQAETAAFLRDLAGADPSETHISLVFLGADTVWKLKKAVRLSFLDFRTLAARERFIRRELELNRVGAPGMYRDVVPVVRRPDGTLTIGEADATDLPVVDWVLRMARVPSHDFLEVIAASGGLTPALLDAIADAVAGYHAALPPVRDVDPAAALRQVAVGNRRSALDAGLPDADVRAWLDAQVTAIDAIASWLGERAAGGFVRRAHGDLHLGNLCLWQGQPVLFDALEFDEAMATIDLGYDLAFLLMDLDHRVARAAANRVLNRYVARNGDAALTRGLPAFLSLRALVRAHVEASRGNMAAGRGYLAAAAAYLRPPPALVVAVGGLQGTGKSTLARSLAAELGAAPGALVLRSDEIRKRLHDAAPAQRLPETAYSEAASNAVFGALTDAAQTVAAGGHAVIADATFLDLAQRDAIAAAARRAGVRFVGIWLNAPLAILEARLASRRGDASDAGVAVLRAASRNDPGAGNWHQLDASDAAACLTQARSVLAPK